MEFVPGFLQGLTRTCVGYPFDYMKIRAQHNPKYNFVDFLMKLKKEHKYAQLYRGISLPLIFNPLRRSIQFTIYERMNVSHNPFVSAGVAGCAISLINVPYYSLLSTYIIDKSQHGIIHHIRNRLGNNRSRLVRGYKLETVRGCITSTIYLGTYGSLRAKLGTDNVACITSAVASSVLTWTLTYPLDTMRLWCQVASTKQSQKEIIFSQIHNFGFFSLWRGIYMTYLRIVPTTALSMLMYEYARKYV